MLLKYTSRFISVLEMNYTGLGPNGHKNGGIFRAD